MALALVLGTSDTGIETVRAGAAVGFGGGNPQQYQPDSMPIPGRLAPVCYLLGVVLVSVLTVAAFLRGASARAGTHINRGRERWV